jgi:hypothetical protein
MYECIERSRIEIGKLFSSSIILSEKSCVSKTFQRMPSSGSRMKNKFVFLIFSRKYVGWCKNHWKIKNWSETPEYIDRGCRLTFFSISLSNLFRIHQESWQALLWNTMNEQSGCIHEVQQKTSEGLFYFETRNFDICNQTLIYITMGTNPVLMDVEIILRNFRW